MLGIGAGPHPGVWTPQPSRSSLIFPIGQGSGPQSRFQSIGGGGGGGGGVVGSVHVHECAHTLSLPPSRGCQYSQSPLSYLYIPCTNTNTPPLLQTHPFTHMEHKCNSTQSADTRTPSWVNTHRPAIFSQAPIAWTHTPLCASLCVSWTQAASQTQNISL